MKTRTHHHRLMLGACLSLVFVACTGSGGAEPIAGQQRATVSPSSSNTDDLAGPAAVPVMPNVKSADLLRQERRYQFPDPLGSLQLEHGVAPVMLSPGEHRADSLGIETTLQLDRWWRLEAEEPGSFWLTRPDAPVGGLLPTIAFLRPVGLAPVNRVAEPDLFRGEYTVPPDDLGGWLDEVSQIEVLDRGSVTVGDRQGEWFDVDVRDDAGQLSDICEPGKCVNTWWSGGTRSTVARDLESLRYYSFPDPAGPIYVLVAAADEEFEEWNELAADLLTSTAFGPSAPHPVQPGTSVGLERGHERGTTWRFHTFPSLLVTAQLASLSNQRPGILTFQPWRGYGFRSRAELVRPAATFDGEPLDDLAATEAALVEAGLERLPDDLLVDGAIAVYGGVVDEPIIRRAELMPGDDADFVRWPEFDESHLRIWVLESPGGPLLLSATAESAELLASAVPQAELLADSIEFG